MLFGQEGNISRADFIQRWRNKASESEDAFDRFFAAWIALVIAARAQLNEDQLSQPDTDRKAVIAYFESNAEDVERVLQGMAGDTTWLSKRRGTGTGQPIVDVYVFSPQHLRAVFDDLASVWAGQAQRKPRWVANATAELVNHVRNHMFHGVKDPDDLGDRALIERLNPVLIGVLAACEPKAG